MRNYRPGGTRPSRLESRFLEGRRSNHRQWLPGKGWLETDGCKKGNAARWPQNFRWNTWRRGTWRKAVAPRMDCAAIRKLMGLGWPKHLVYRARGTISQFLRIRQTPSYSKIHSPEMEDYMV